MARKPEIEDEDDPAHPRRTVDLVGHDAAEQELAETFRSGRMPHAWLLAGPPGIGKATLAWRLARFVLAGATTGPGLHVDPEHPVFRRIVAGGHADVFAAEREIDRRTGRLRKVIAVEQIRDLKHLFTLKAAEGGWRVAIVDPADEMNANAANAVLKILEEPPPKVLILLISHAPGRLLPTIRSRCRMLTLRPLEPAAMAGVVGRWRPDLKAEDLRALALLAEGRPGQALALAAQGGLDLYRSLVEVLKPLGEGQRRLDITRVHAFADRVGAGGEGAATFVLLTQLLTEWLARAIRSTAAAEPPLEIVAGEAALIASLDMGQRLERWVEVWEKSGNLFARGEALNLDRRQMLVQAFAGIEKAARGDPT
ncbi:DNA polymerase III subunit delta' [Zavarzinia sp. CC-PAN008]|uniref:DNA polymerase III subunit delta' n=1 Tax=Zavarzinia sp. CC-PAN008 TaxID=3243332 RepID=UPI003F744DB8